MYPFLSHVGMCVTKEIVGLRDLKDWWGGRWGTQLAADNISRINYQPLAMR
jgi:hypothetical protein